MNLPLIFYYIFPKARELNYDEKTNEIEMIIFKNGFKKTIKFKNTYATYKDNLLFAKPINNELYGIALEKGYAISQCTNQNIESGYKIMNKGGSGFYFFENILGAQSEKFFSKKEFNFEGYKLINKKI